MSVNIDDVYSNVITLPFPFCFYGVTYNSLIIGSNGNINFNTASAGGPCAWQFNANCPSPALTGLGNIFGIYHDIDPSVCGSINWYLIGTAPCQKFVVSFDQICQYSCTSVKSRHMMVLYKTSNFIDVYVESNHFVRVGILEMPLLVSKTQQVQMELLPQTETLPQLGL